MSGIPNTGVGTGGTLVPAVRRRLPMLQAWPTHHVEMGGLPDPVVRGSDPDPDPSLLFCKNKI